MRRSIAFVLAALLISIPAAQSTTALADDSGSPTPWEITRDSDGNLYLWVDRGYYHLTPGTMQPETIATYPDLGGTGPVGPADQGFGPQLSINTANGPRTELQLTNELRNAGYGGPWELTAMLAAYNKASGAPAPAAAAPAAAAAPSGPSASSNVPMSNGTEAILQGDGLTIRTVDPDVQQAGYHDIGMNFEVANTTGQTLNFQYSPGNFKLQLGNGVIIPGRDGDPYQNRTQITVNDLKNNTSYRFPVLFAQEGGWDAFQKQKAVINGYTITLHDFAPRLGGGSWHKDVAH